ncbi:beta family protein [Pandoraea sputorum]|uniref:beta family protein n=1 Tax=Pandoraea sputorum TaxID=93222 RepID=UPI002F415CE2
MERFAKIRAEIKPGILMFTEMHYVPILKWRQGEYIALERLSSSIKAWVTPLFEIPTEAWDFETEAPAKSLDDHLIKFGTRLKQKWDARRCFVDSPYIDGTAKISTGVHHLVHIFDLARAAGAKPVPVAGLDRSPAYLNAIKAIIREDARGLCLRLTPDDFDPTLSAKIGALLTKVGATVEQCDLVIDCSSDIADSPHTQALLWKALIGQVPALNSWRSFTVAGTAFPQALPSATFRPRGTVKRNDWLAYKLLRAQLSADDRMPTFGDYAVAHPKTELIDPRMLDPLAKIKYTIDDAWVIVAGLQVRKNGRGQYKGLCQSIVSAVPIIFLGAAYSFGDKFIEDCANGGSTGGASTWPMVGSNHHITKVVRDVATLFGASTHP